MSDEKEFLVKRVGPVEVPVCDGYETEERKTTKVTTEVWYRKDGTACRFRYFEGSFAEVDVKLDPQNGPELAKILRRSAELLESRLGEEKS